jgi:hypothetical protein
MALSNAERQRRFIERLKARAQVQAGPVTNEPCDAQVPRELTNYEQDQILNIVLQLLATVDHPHRKKFYKFLVETSVSGVYIPTCSQRGWKGGGFVIDDSLLTRLWASIKSRAGCALQRRA